LNTQSHQTLKMRAMFALVLLVAAANAEVFQFIHQGGTSTTYDVRGAVTVGAHRLTGEKAALEYNGTIALQKAGPDTFLAKFTKFTVGKYDHLYRDIEDDGFGLNPEEERFVKTIREGGLYEQEMQKPVKVHMQNGQFTRMVAGQEHKQWSLNVYRAVFTLLQNQVGKPTNTEVPHIEYKYEDGIAGHCKVQYEIFSLGEDKTVPEVYNITKTKNFKDCKEARPVYLHLKDTKRGCAGVCDEHRPENFLTTYDEEKTDYDMKPTPGCPVNRLRTDTLVTLHKITKYNVSKGLLDEARSDSMDLYRLFGGEMEVRTRLYLGFQGTQGPQVEEPGNPTTYNTLQLRLPKEEQELDIPIYALMKEHGKHGEYPQYFTKHFEAAIRELTQLKGSTHTEGAKNTPAYIIELVQAMSAMTTEEIKRTMPTIVSRPQPQGLSENDQLQRQFWIELLGKGGSKSAVKVATELIKKNVLTPTEVRRVLQDIGAFQSYPDTEMIEEVLTICTGEHHLTSTGKATACAAAGKIISKGCRSKVTYPPYTQEHHYGKQSPQTEQEKEQTMGRLAIKPELRCTVEKLQTYIGRLSQVLRATTEFKQVVAYINGLAKIEKPEVLPELIGYVNGTATNLYQIHEQGENQEEAREFVRKVAILSLRSVASKYPKEVNPIVRVIYENTTEEVQTRILAFDVWMNTQPGQWEVEKIMQIANKDTSFELTHYVYTALKTAMYVKEPCEQLLAKRIRDAWTQIRPFDFGFEFSHLRSKGFYDNFKDYGVRGIWKMVTSNTTILPTFTQAKLEQVRGPFMKTLFGAKLLVKGGDKIWEEFVGKDGFLERLAQAVDGQVKKGDRNEGTRQLLKDISAGMSGGKHNTENDETPKAVLFWRLFSGDAIIPMDREYINELKQELLHGVTKVGKGGFSGHFIRVFVPTKGFHVEPSTIGFPIVHSTIHPIVVSIRFENFKLKYNNLENRAVPETFEFTGTVQPTILSLRQSRIFVGDIQGKKTPTMKVSNIKEFNFPTTFHVLYDNNESRFKFNYKPHFDRFYHSGHCTELTLEENVIIDADPQTDGVRYGNCIRTMPTPFYHKKEFAGKYLGMSLKLNGTSHEPWSGLPIFGSDDLRRDGMIAALLNRVANKGMKHHVLSLYLEADKQDPINEWDFIVDVDSNLEAWAKIPLSQQVEKIQKMKVQYKPRRDQSMSSELQQVVQKVEKLLEKHQDNIEEATVEKQMLMKIEGRYQGQPKRQYKVAMKRIFNLEKTEQQLALVVESKQSRNGLELFANVSYPKISSPFHFEPQFVAEDELLNGTVTAKFHGDTEHMYRIDFNATKTEEQHDNSELKWFETRCLAEQNAAKTLTDACRKALLKHNSLDRMEMSIHLPKSVPPTMKQLAKKLLTLMKYKYYSHMSSDISGRQYREQQDKEQQIYISANTTRVSPWSLLYNVWIETPRENVTLSNIRVRGVRPPHMQFTMKQQLKHVVFRGQKETPCVLGEQAVRTYDNVTFGLDVKPECEYVLTRDCQGTPDFTVTFTIVNFETYAKKIKTQLENTIIELHPFTTTDRHFNVHVNDTEYRVTYEKPLVFQYAAGKKAFIHAHETSNPHHTPVVHIFTEPKDFRVDFDGFTAQVHVDQKYKGTTCGVCGNNDNEQTHEFTGPNGVEYHYSNEFIASYGLTDTCRVPVENRHHRRTTSLNHELESVRRNHKIERLPNPGKYWDSSEEGTTDYPSHAGYGYTEKTLVFTKDNLICFSYEPVRVCKPGFVKDGVAETKQVTGVCLDKNNENAKQAWRMSRRENAILDISTLEQHKVGTTGIRTQIPKCKVGF
jgi:hypothetical protein